ncbi:hypothetical protein [Jannaschia aquimarina]|uniref:Uncharacterized protein n=1 Tax=Jannaschia aquimarina TaxID=935700 RepID=A0A0D1D479_9RHOB|nr:hypothetical protein [Jannaschia aquimarina]KIT14858.1 hypothetical protein jaqu_31830 [Jannaschia aquimarina]SNS57710.1 hypothetical protein SAMN05421775_101508 [Jannaschia aquimarina]
MKTLMTTALIATLAAPAIAQVDAGPEGAIMHFNQSLEGNDVVTLSVVDTEIVSTRSELKSNVIDRFNASLSGNEVITATPTLVSGEPAFGSDIFEQIDAED